LLLAEQRPSARPAARIPPLTPAVGGGTAGGR
jgi:hypothetical protein